MRSVGHKDIDTESEKIESLEDNSGNACDETWHEIHTPYNPCNTLDGALKGFAFDLAIAQPLTFHEMIDVEHARARNTTGCRRECDVNSLECRATSKSPAESCGGYAQEHCDGGRKNGAGSGRVSAVVGGGREATPYMDDFRASDTLKRHEQSKVWRDYSRTPPLLQNGSTKEVAQKARSRTPPLLQNGSTKEVAQKAGEEATGQGHAGEAVEAAPPPQDTTAGGGADGSGGWKGEEGDKTGVDHRRGHGDIDHGGGGASDGDDCVDGSGGCDGDGSARTSKHTGKMAKETGLVYLEAQLPLTFENPTVEFPGDSISGRTLSELIKKKIPPRIAESSSIMLQLRAPEGSLSQEELQHESTIKSGSIVIVSLSFDEAHKMEPHPKKMTMLASTSSLATGGIVLNLQPGCKFSTEHLQKMSEIAQEDRECREKHDILMFHLENLNKKDREILSKKILTERNEKWKEEQIKRILESFDGLWKGIGDGMDQLQDWLEELKSELEERNLENKELNLNPGRVRAIIRSQFQRKLEASKDFARAELLKYVTKANTLHFPDKKLFETPDEEVERVLKFWREKGGSERQIEEQLNEECERNNASASSEATASAMVQVSEAAGRKAHAEGSGKGRVSAGASTGGARNSEGAESGAQSGADASAGVQYAKASDSVSDYTVASASTRGEHQKGRQELVPPAPPPSARPAPSQVCTYIYTHRYIHSYIER
jgi:hypothetical protein